MGQVNGSVMQLNQNIQREPIDSISIAAIVE